MCGIAGLWNLSIEHPVATIRAMLEAMRHRGPDGRGTMEYAGGAAGMVRLALVDLSDRGQQPIWSDDRRVAILFNGEMYNFREERKRLEGVGCRFRTGTDTEVVLNLYLERGLKFHERMRGMYAVAFFDWRQTAAQLAPVLTLARGPLGIKPLYVAHLGGDPCQVAFASEIRALLASGLVPGDICPDALARYLAHGFVVQPDTIVSGVRMLEAGTLERYAPGESMVRERFWRMPPYAPRQETLDASANRLRATLDESITIHAMADAPIGAFLSGGVDSTAIVALMRKHVGDLHTYTIKFPDIPVEHEVEEALATARVYDCRHTVVEVTSRDVCDLLPRFAGDLDQPSCDGLNTWLMSRAAAHDVTGVLSGIGGDEIFAGYPVTRRMTRYAMTTSWQGQPLARQLAHRIAPWLPEGRLRHRAENLAARRSGLTAWLHAHSVFHYRLARRMAGLTAGGASQEAPFTAILDRDCVNWITETPVGLSCVLDNRFYLIDQLLRDSDAASMAHSVELRAPFVDLEMLAFSRSCADEFKLRTDGGSSDHYYGSGSKRVLVHALRDVLPLSISNRPKKGFVLPFAHWMRGALAPLVEDACSDETILRRGLIDPQVVATVRKNARAGVPGTLFPCLWALMILELWCRGTLDHDRRRPVQKP
jgi:asparagine synthase (glutamine-hydrolysing)